MLYFNRNVVSEGIHTNKTSKSKELDYHCIISEISKKEAINLMQHC